MTRLGTTAEIFPKEFQNGSGATHTDMFLAWALLSGMGGSTHVTDSPDNLQKLKSRSAIPGCLFFKACDGKFTDEDLVESGMAFAREYFNLEERLYLHDYAAALCQELPTPCHVQGTWENFEQLTPVLDRRFSEREQKICS